MSIKCGNCKDHHETVADVRACYEHDGRVEEGSPNDGLEVRRWKTGDPVPFPAGRYAVEHEGVLKFYKMDVPTEGRWKGYVFVHVQASDEWWSVKSRATREDVINLIAKDPEAAMLAYGREIGKCGHCGRTLTDEDSRAAGIGPVCRRKVSF